jgi:hypothetical protein
MDNSMIQNLLLNGGVSNEKMSFQGAQNDSIEQLPPDDLLRYFMSQQSQQQQFSGAHPSMMGNQQQLSGSVMGASVNGYSQSGLFQAYMNQNSQPKPCPPQSSQLRGYFGSSSSLMSPGVGGRMPGNVSSGGLNYLLDHLSPKASQASLGSMNSQGSFLQRVEAAVAPQTNAQWEATPPAQSDLFAQNGMLGPWSAASAELLGDLCTSNLEKGKKSRKKSKDRPKRPLSAYNIFFKEERQRILETIPDRNPTEVLTDGGKAGKRKPHGKIDFQSLAKLIGKRWQSLAADEVNIYKEKAGGDMMRYRQEMEVHVALDSNV